MEQYNIAFLNKAAEKVGTTKVGTMFFEFPYEYEDEHVDFVYHVRVLIGKSTYRVSINNDSIAFACNKNEYLTKVIHSRIKESLEENKLETSLEYCSDGTGNISISYRRRL